MFKHALGLSILVAVPACLIAQTAVQQPASKQPASTVPATAESGGSDSVSVAEIPEKMLTMELSETKQKIPISPVTSFPLCTSDGNVLLDLLTAKDLSQHTLLLISGDKTQTYLPSAISDLHDVFVLGFYSSGSTVAFLVRGTRQTAPSTAANKSPAGYDWSSYHRYLARFKLDGTFERSVELDTTYEIYHAALFPSGEILSLGYDSLNSSLRLLLFDSSGKMVRTMDLPAARRTVDGGAAYGSTEAAMASASVFGSVSFTPYKESILVWRRDSDDPIVEVRPGGAMREVPLQTPKELEFVDMIPADDRWVAHFRRRGASRDLPYDRTNYTYFELRPQDASIVATLSISPNIPPKLDCETDGKYMSFSADKENNIQFYYSK